MPIRFTPKMLIRFYLLSMSERQNDVKDVFAQCQSHQQRIEGVEEKRGEMLSSLTDGAQPFFKALLTF